MSSSVVNFLGTKQTKQLLSRRQNCMYNQPTTKLCIKETSSVRKLFYRI